MTEEKKSTENVEKDLAVVGGTDAPSFDGEDAHSDIRQQAKELKDRAYEGYWDLAVVLYEIHEKALYRSWTAEDGTRYDTWKDYVDIELNISIRAVQKYLKVQRWFETLPAATQGWLRSLGWTKCEKLIGVVNKDNVGEWRSKIEGLTVRQIEAMMDAESASGSGGSGSGGEGSSTGGDDSERPTKVSYSVFAGQRDMIKAAVDKAKEVAQTEKDGHALTMICQEYLSCNTDIVDADTYYRNIENATGHKIIAMKIGDDGEPEVVHGSEHLDDDKVSK